MKKLILALCLFFPVFTYSAEPQLITFGEYTKKIEGLAAECALKNMSQFNGFCLSQKNDDHSKTSINVALQVASFELFYKKCEHADYQNVNDILTRALSVEEAKKFFEEIKTQKEALDTYSNYFDYCKIKDENNLAVSKKLKWFEYMINKYSSTPRIGQNQDVHGDSSRSSFPEYFIGTFEDTVPNKVGGTIPSTKFLLTCSSLGTCTVRIGDNIAGSFSSFSPVTDLQYAAYALAYAKEHNNVPVTSASSWQANNLKPLLSSSSAIETCVELRDKSLPQGYMLLCKLDQDPWAKNTVLLMGTRLSNCGDLFCRYEIFPLFRKLTA
jgi:hypothetical protein